MNTSRDIYFLARARATELAIELFGEPNAALSTADHLRFGSRGSIKVTVAGSYSGLVSDWSRDIHGDISDFVRREYGLAGAEVAQYLKQRLGYDVAAGKRLEPTRVSAVSSLPEKAEEAVAAARVAWDDAKPFRGSPGHEYLSRRLAGLDVPETVVASGQLRWSETSPIGGIGTLLARMHDPETGKSTGLHRTFVNDQMQKLGVGLLGRRGAIQLYGANTVGTLLVAEGVETSISAGMLFGHAKVMAAGSAGALASFPITDEPSIVICGDNDPPDKVGRCPGQAAMEECADRWRLAGRMVTTKLPRTTGDDFNDLLVRIANGN
jgi:hypothetical protein